MRIIRTIAVMRRFSSLNRKRQKAIGFVPTMGALHAGHLSLIRRCHRENDLTVVSIFVNPAQFGPQEDFGKYPRNLKRDARLCRREGVDIIFYPHAREIYPRDYKTYVSVEDLSGLLCGESRPGHFRGVTTVVAKLFNIVQPDCAYFGQKDAQQATIIKKMAADLNIPVKIRIIPTVREINGLAMSSRNAYLNKQERKDAAVLSQSLHSAKKLIKNGMNDADKIINAMKLLVRKKKRAKIDYISIVNAENLKPVKRVKGNCLIALAVKIGRTRLIDNLLVENG